MNDGTLQFDVFGRRLLVEIRGSARQAWWPGAEGKRRPAAFPIPDDLDAAGIAAWLDDLLHEQATPAHPAVRLL